MTQNHPHARASDLPGWPCPPRVRDIPHHQDSWGWLCVFALPQHKDRVLLAQDELGYLWVKGSAVPEFRTPHESDDNPGALVFWTEKGTGLWVHPKSCKFLASCSRLDMDTDDWLPVNEVAAEWPAFIKETA